MKKKSAKKACDTFKAEVQEVRDFIAATAGLGDAHVSWCHEQAIIRIYRSFENLMLSCLICALNNDTKELSAVTGIDFPKHLTDDVCEYIILGERYFDFRGRDGLIKTIRRFVQDNHYLLVAVKGATWKTALEQLAALRNYAAHDSSQSKRAALQATAQTKISSAGSWLKKQNRLGVISDRLDALADTIRAAAPY